jgi:hypothetical protein
MKKQFIKTSADNACYINLSENRVVCEIFYGRLLSLFEVIRDKCKYEHVFYDKFFVVFTPLINYHLKKNPLRSDVRGYYEAAMQKRLDKVPKKIRKEKESKERDNIKIRGRKRQRDSLVDVREIFRRMNE